VPKTQTGYFRAGVQAEQLEPRLVLSGTAGLTPAELPDSVTEQQTSLYAPTMGLDPYFIQEVLSQDTELKESELDTVFSELTKQNTSDLLSDDCSSADADDYEYRVDLITENIYHGDSYPHVENEYNSEYRHPYRKRRN
jgi:hypothetical protein